MTSAEVLPRVRRGAVWGVPEIAASMMLLVFDCLLAPGGRILCLALGAVACLGSALAARRPGTGVLLTCLALTGLCLLPAGLVGASSLACTIAVVSCVARGRMQVAYLGTAWFYVTSVYMSFERSPNYPQLVVMGAWLLVLGASWLVGWLLRQMVSHQEVKIVERLQSQRQEIAIELHDSLAHELALLSLRAEEAKIAGGATTEDLEFIAQTARRSSRSLRHLMGLLHMANDAPAMPMKLTPTLDENLSRLRAAGFQVTCEHAEGELEELPVSLSDLLAKVTREATNNILRHGVATQPCAIFSTVAADQVSMVFTNRCPPDAVRPEGLGLTGLRERVAAAGGKLTVQQRDQTWYLRVSLPWRHAAGVIPPGA